MKLIIRKHILSLFEDGELIRIKSTGEIFTYHLGEGGANFSTTVIIQLKSGYYSIGSLWTSQVEKVNKDGVVIDDFKQYENI